MISCKNTPSQSTFLETLCSILEYLETNLSQHSFNCAFAYDIQIISDIISQNIEKCKLQTKSGF